MKYFKKQACIYFWDKKFIIFFQSITQLLKLNKLCLMIKQGLCISMCQNHFFKAKKIGFADLYLPIAVHTITLPPNWETPALRGSCFWSYFLIFAWLCSVNTQMPFGTVLSPWLTISVSITFLIIILAPTHWPFSPRVSMTLDSAFFLSVLGPHSVHKYFTAHSGLLGSLVMALSTQ